MRDVAMRPFTAEVSYPGKKPFWVGTLFAPAGAKDHEMDALALAEVTKFWGDHLPDGWALPRVQKVLWGSVFFVPENAQQEAT